jgi:hypothetical protein
MYRCRNHERFDGYVDYAVRSAFLVIEAIGFFLVAWTVMMLAPVLKKNIAGDYAPSAIR